MRLVLDGLTALEYWLSNLPPKKPRPLRSPTPQLTDFAGTTCHKIKTFFEDNGGQHETLSLLVDNQKKRRQSDNLICRSWNGRPMPPRSLYSVGSEIFVVGPELTLVRSAPSLSRLELLRAATDLCGIYAKDADKRIDLVKRTPVTSVATISNYLSDLGAAKGAGLVKAILPWVVEGSASPRETSMDMELRLPTRAGGQAFPTFHANERIDPSSEFANLTRRSYLVGDAVWKDPKLVFEYNSSKHHDTDEEMEFDFEKITTLQAMGYQVVTVSTRHFNDFDLFASVVSACKANIGIRDRYASEVYEARRTTHEEILAVERAQRNLPSLVETARWKFIAAHS